MVPPSAPVAPPTPQEVQRKLSVHSTARPNLKKAPAPPPAHVSGTESDSDPGLPPDVASSPNAQPAGAGGGLLAASTSQPPLSSIAERRAGSGEESEEEDDEEEGGWKAADGTGKPRGAFDESVIKAGYLWKKGERRKTWKKRWFVLRPAHLAYYKTSAEYKLLRLLDLADIHSCTPVSLKKHENVFGLVSPVRTFYLQASSTEEVNSWVKAVQEARYALMATSTQNSLASSPIPIPSSHAGAHQAAIVSLSPSFHSSYPQNVTSSDSEDASPNAQRTYSTSSQNRSIVGTSPSRQQMGPKDASKVVVSGYLMKCGSKRHNWRKRWFVLNGEKLFYSDSHMNTKPHRQFSVTQILDALEFDLRSHKHNVVSPGIVTSPLQSSTSPDDAESAHGARAFKIVTTQRTLLLCAPSEEEEIKWLSAVRALIARRTGAGVVPGDSEGSVPVKSLSTPPGGAHDGGQGGLGTSASANPGLRNKVRKMSISGPPAIAVPPSAVSAEGHERRS